MSGWLIDESSARLLRDARRLQLRPTESQIQAFEAQQLEARGVTAQDGGVPLPRIMKVAGNVAQISVEGVLTKAPDILAYFFGGGNTTYRAIMASLAIAAADPAIRSVVMYVDSPGGSVDGLFEALAAIEQFRAVKALSVKAANAMSAAYGIAAAAGKIEATNAGARIGSIGVAAQFAVDEEIVDITNTDSPDKRPDVTTEEGKAVVRRELDAMHELFIDTIARGRGTDAKDVRENFGRGATMLATDAKRRGMIDSIAKPAPRTASAAAATETTTTIGARGADEKDQKPMDLRLLKAQHPDVFEAAAAEGEARERDRVSAHLTLGNMGGAEGLAMAMAAIKEGKPLNFTAQAEYTALAQNKSDRTRRQGDDATVAGAVDGAAAPAASAATTTAPAAPAATTPNGQPVLTDEQMGEEVARRMMERRGKKVA